MNERLPKSLLLSGLIALVFYAGFDLWPNLAVTLMIAAKPPSSMLTVSVLWVVLWAIYLPAVIWVARKPPATREADRWALLWVVIVAILYRVVLLPGEPDLSSDFYRYLWDGRVFHGGVNPYALAPTSLALEPFRYDNLHALLNRPDAIGVYPPIAQWVYFAVTVLRPDPLGLRLAFLAFEAVGVAALLLLLRGAGRPLAQSLVYLWNPLIVIEMTRGGHSDALMLPFLLLALLCRMKGRMGTAGIMLGLATLSRLYPMVILPALMRRMPPGKRGILGFEATLPLAFAITVGLGYLPFAGMEGGVAGQLPGYLGLDWEEFNAGVRIALRHLLSWVVGADDPWMYAAAAGRILLGGFFLLSIRVLLREEESDQTLSRAIALLGGWLLLGTPSVEPWYAWGLVALAAVTLSPAWIWFSGAVGFSYLKFVLPSHLVPAWVLVLEFLPTLLLLAYVAGKARAWRPQSVKDEFAPWPRRLPPPRRRLTRLPIYLIGAFPVIAIILVLYFFIAGCAP